MVVAKLKARESASERTPARRSKAVKATRSSGLNSWPWSVNCARRPKGGQRSLRDISAELALRGIMNERGKPYSAASINSMLRGIKQVPNYG
jgi:hypothetical protein